MRNDKILVVDIEATCFENKEEQNNQPSEIIEIGCCLIDVGTLDISRKHSYIVRPKYSSITQYCTNLTGYTWDDVKCGMPFSSACNKLIKEYGSKNRAWSSWGDTDKLHFKKECADKNANYPFGSSHINVSMLFNIFFNNNKCNISLEDALDRLEMDFEGAPHKGCDDAFNTAKILKRILSLGRNKNE